MAQRTEQGTGGAWEVGSRPAASLLWLTASWSTHSIAWGPGWQAPPPPPQLREEGSLERETLKAQRLAESQTAQKWGMETPIFRTQLLAAEGVAGHTRKRKW